LNTQTGSWAACLAGRGGGSVNCAARIIKNTVGPLYFEAGWGRQ